MNGCVCGQPMARWGLHDVFCTCLHAYVAVLPERPSLLIFMRMRRQPIAPAELATLPAPAQLVLFIRERAVPGALLESAVGGS